VSAASLSEGVHAEVHDGHGILVHDVHQQSKEKKDEKSHAIVPLRNVEDPG
jgi:hypothetical protein